MLVKDFQLDPVTHAVLHADFYRVRWIRRCQVTIPVIVKGEPKGVKQQGGILEFIRREIEIEVLPGDIPEHIEVDVSELMLHQGIRVRDIATDARWKPVSDPEMMLVHVIMPKAEEAPATAEAAAAAAPRLRLSPKSSRRARRKKKGKTRERGEEEVAELVHAPTAVCVQTVQERR